MSATPASWRNLLKKVNKEIENAKVKKKVSHFQITDDLSLRAFVPEGRNLSHSCLKYESGR